MGIFYKLFGKKDLIHAAEKGDTETVKMLLNKGADVNAKDKDGETALMYAAQKGHTEIVEILLINGADINAKDKDGNTALILAAAWGVISTVGKVIYAYTVHEEHIKTVKMLLTMGADVNAKNKDGVTALTYTAPKGYNEIVRLLEQEEQRRREEEQRRKEEEQRRREHKEEQDRYLKELIFLGDNSIELFEEIPECLKTAEECLNRAEIEFSDGAFAPFWDAIENTAYMLGRFDEGVQTIESNSSKYIDLIPKYEGVPPGFPLSRKSVEKLSVSTSTAKRMNEIVRAAQRNFQFATIYEQRKTNQILIAGFTNLAQALDRMTWKITTSIGNLDSSINSLNNTTKNIYSRLDNIADADIKQHSEIIRLESARKEREQKALKMLDNIQRHRKPLI